MTATFELAASGFGCLGLRFALRPAIRLLPAMTDVDPADFDVSTDGAPARDRGE